MTAQAWYQAHGDDGFLPVYLVWGTETQQTPTTEDLMAHATDNGLTYPLLVDIDMREGARFSTDSTMPSLTLLDRGPVVEIIDGDVTEQDIVDLL